MNKLSENYLGTVLNNKDGNNLISAARKALKGSGFGITIYGRNPDRAQFYGKRYRSKNSGYSKKGRLVGYLYKHSYAENLPIKFAERLALYLRPSRALKNFKLYNSSYGSPRSYKMLLKKAKNIVTDASVSL